MTYKKPLLLFLGIFIYQLSALGEVPVKSCEEHKAPLNTTSLETLLFFGHQWLVTHSKDAIGPGPNRFAKENTWVDQEGKLHLKVSKHAKTHEWESSQISSLTSFGYGTYKTHFIVKNKHYWDDNIVFGAFTWDDQIDHSLINFNREIDFEISKWGDSKLMDLQYVIQPVSDFPSENKLGDNHNRFTLDWSANQKVFYTMKWGPKEITFKTSVFDEIKNTEITLNEYEYRGDLNPTPGNAKFQFNLWLYQGKPLSPSKFLDTEIIIDHFDFSPVASPTTKFYSKKEEDAGIVAVKPSE